MASADSKDAHGATPRDPLDQKAKAVGSLNTNFKKLQALFTGAKVLQDGNAVIRLASHGPATITDVILPEERTEPISMTATRMEEEAITGKRRIMRHWYDATPKKLGKFISNFLNDKDNVRLDSFWQAAETTTLTKREHLFYGLCLAAVVYIILGNMGRLACNFIGFIYPLHASYSALKSKSRSSYAHWLKYWCVYSTFAFLDTFGSYYLGPYSAYWFLKCLFVCYLLAPFTQGTDYVYYNYVEPAEVTVDALVEMHNKWEKDMSFLSDSSSGASTPEVGRSAEPLSAEFTTAVIAEDHSKRVQ
uniref:Receptor expression-enhancing protein n=1 Tax=Steinernema glaseri TaxID=37863 RepID=A0A1I7ZZ77_9BILA